MSDVLKGDLFRFRKSAALKVSLLLSFVSVLSLAVILYLVAHGEIGAEIMGSLALLTDAMMVSLLASLVIGLVICGDFTSKTIHREIAMAGRGTIVLAKSLTSMFITAIVLFPYAGVAIAAFASGMDFSEIEGIPSLFIHIITNQAGVAVDVSSLGKAIILCLTGMVVYMARLSICVPVAFIVRRPVAVMTAGIVVSFGFDMLTKGLEEVPVFGDILAYTPYAVIYDLDMGAGAGVIVKALSAGVIFIVLMSAVTYIFFRKAEVK